MRRQTSSTPTRSSCQIGVGTASSIATLRTSGDAAGARLSRETAEPMADARTFERGIPFTGFSLVERGWNAPIGAQPYRGNVQKVLNRSAPGGSPRELVQPVDVCSGAGFDDVGRSRSP